MESEKALVEQYKKELRDLEEGKGLAKCMSPTEIKWAKRDLRKAIDSYQEIYDEKE